MMIPCQKLHALADSVEPTARMYIKQFLTEAESKVKAEVDAAKKCLADYGYKVLETQHHEYQEIA